MERYLADPLDGASPVTIAQALAALKRGELLSPASTQTKTVVTVAGKVVDAAGPPVEYEVKKGETVYGVARKLKTTGHELAVANGLKEPFKIKPGQTLKGPATKAKAYVVQNGDTLYAIARRFSVETIRKEPDCGHARD